MRQRERPELEILRAQSGDDGLMLLEREILDGNEVTQLIRGEALARYVRDPQSNPATRFKARILLQHLMPLVPAPPALPATSRAIFKTCS